MFCWWLCKNPDFTLCLSLSLVNALIRLWWWWTWRDLDWSIFGGQVCEQNSGSKCKKKQVGDVMAKKPQQFLHRPSTCCKKSCFFFFVFCFFFCVLFSRLLFIVLIVKHEKISLMKLLYSPVVKKYSRHSALIHIINQLRSCEVLPF